ncbi:Hypothetical protein CINCED_3A017465 [Cinara cedri]|uniref:Uncharacterized protein n=1 Tax=Cinara cedri TaxID=506608 RepID=A0A5E4MII7_9HEMI|nr:Hypothetical protein CINCED_3A017465 [Cinara cedri]
MDASEISDKRLAHIYEEVVKTFKFKPEIWTSMMKSPEFLELIMNFLNDAGKDKLLFSMGTGILIPLSDIPKELNTKLSCFLKLESVKITDSNYKFMLVKLEASINPFQDIKTVTENTLAHLSANRDIFKNYSHDIEVAFQDRLNDFLTNLKNVLSAQNKNRITLVMPFGFENIDIALKNIETSDGKMIDEVLKLRLEEQVYVWFKQISTLVQIMPDSILELDPNATHANCKC